MRWAESEDLVDVRRDVERLRGVDEIRVRTVCRRNPPIDSRGWVHIVETALFGVEALAVATHCIDH